MITWCMCVDLGSLGSPYGTNASKILVFIQSRENAPTAQLQHQMVTAVQEGGDVADGDSAAVP